MKTQFFYRFFSMMNECDRQSRNQMFRPERMDEKIDASIHKCVCVFCDTSKKMIWFFFSFQKWINFTFTDVENKQTNEKIWFSNVYRSIDRFVKKKLAKKNNENKKKSFVFNLTKFDLFHPDYSEFTKVFCFVLFWNLPFIIINETFFSNHEMFVT